ncbi:MAG: hypothetical protein QOJ87_2377, partial [Verrucomicrobiota bacterium]
TRKDNGLNQYRMWSPYSIINYDDDIGNGWGSPGAANGVLMQDGWVTAGYNALNQPMYIWSGNVGWTYFGYDGLGRCVKRWADNGSVAYMYYDGWDLIQDGPQSSIADRVYVHGARTDEVVAQITPANNWIRYFHYDANGNCTLQTDGGGGMVEQYDYDAFGFPYFYDASGNATGYYDSQGRWIGYSPWGNRFLFTGREWLRDLKLYDYRARLYNPELGRFMQPDPKEFAAGDYNLYRYCHNDPVNRRDPTGLQDFKPVTVELQKLRTVTGSNIPQWVTVLRGIANDALKTAFNAMVKAALGDHADRTGAFYTDGTRSSYFARAVHNSHLVNGRMEKDDHFTEVIPREKPLALLLHFHNDIHNVSSTDPSGIDSSSVYSNKVPMLFSSESLYKQNHGFLLTPNGQQQPTQTPVVFNW